MRSLKKRTALWPKSLHASYTHCTITAIKTKQAITRDNLCRLRNLSVFGKRGEFIISRTQPQGTKTPNVPFGTWGVSVPFLLSRWHTQMAQGALQPLLHVALHCLSARVGLGEGFIPVTKLYILGCPYLGWNIPSPTWPAFPYPDTELKWQETCAHGKRFSHLAGSFREREDLLLNKNLSTRQYLQRVNIIFL